MYLGKGRFYGIFQRAFFFRIVYVEFRYICRVLDIFWFQDYVVLSKTAFTVGSDTISDPGIYDKAQDKTMIKTGYSYNYLFNSIPV